MKQKVLYEERLTARWMIGTFSLLALVFLFLLFFQLVRGPVGQNPAPTWFFLLLFAVFSMIGYNFKRLVIRLTEKDIRVSYGVLSRTMPYGSVAKCYSSRTHTVRYGGWGIRIWRVKGEWKLGYSVVGAPLVVIELKKGMYKEFLFSSRNSVRVIEIINRQIMP
jgi:hypothetical protein